MKFKTYEDYYKFIHSNKKKAIIKMYEKAFPRRFIALSFDELVDKFIKYYSENKNSHEFTHIIANFIKDNPIAELDDLEVLIADLDENDLNGYSSFEDFIEELENKAYFEQDFGEN